MKREHERTFVCALSSVDAEDLGAARGSVSLGPAAEVKH